MTRGLDTSLKRDFLNWIRSSSNLIAIEQAQPIPVKTRTFLIQQNLGIPFFELSAGEIKRTLFTQRRCCRPLYSVSHFSFFPKNRIFFFFFSFDTKTLGCDGESPTEIVTPLIIYNSPEIIKLNFLFMFCVCYREREGDRWECGTSRAFLYFLKFSTKPKEIGPDSNS